MQLVQEGVNQLPAPFWNINSPCSTIFYTRKRPFSPINCSSTLLTVSGSPYFSIPSVLLSASARAICPTLSIHPQPTSEVWCEPWKQSPSRQVNHRIELYKILASWLVLNQWPKMLTASDLSSLIPRSMVCATLKYCFCLYVYEFTPIVWRCSTSCLWFLAHSPYLLGNLILQSFIYTITLEYKTMTTCMGTTLLKRDSYTSNPHLFTTSIMRVLNKTIWKIQHKQYSQQKWSDILRMMVEANIEQLEIQLTYTNTVLNDIAGIRFADLAYLNLEVNNIANIEPIAKLHAPILEKLRLAHNQIVSIRPLAKMHCKYLKELHLQGNFINQFDGIAQAYFSYNFEKLLLETWNEKRVQGQNIAWIMKLRMKNIKKIEMTSTKRLKDNVVREMVEAKYPKVVL